MLVVCSVTCRIPARRPLIASSLAQAMSFLGKPVFLWDKGWAFLSMALWANLPSTNWYQSRSLNWPISFLTPNHPPAFWKDQARSPSISLTLIKAFFTNVAVAISPVLATYPLICWMNIDCLSLVSVSHPWDHFHMLSTLPHTSMVRTASESGGCLALTQNCCHFHNDKVFEKAPHPTS